VAQRGGLAAKARSLGYHRQELVGDTVTFVVNRNVCVGSCSFCGFRRSLLNAKGAYFHDQGTVIAKLEDAVRRGATEICMHSGLTPELHLAFYDSLFREIKERWPTLYLHALLPEEIRYIAEESGRSVEDVRRILCPEKLTSGEWVEIVKSAHTVGIPTTSAIMYNHIETSWHRLQHPEVIRNLQRESGGISEFVLLPFQVQHNMLGKYFGIR